MTTLEAPPPVVDEEVPSPAPVRLAGTARAWAWFAERRWPTFVVFAVLGLAATATSSPGAYIGDSRYEIYANPARRLAKGFAIWDASRGLGRVREDLWVGVNAPLALLRVVGLDAAWTERVWHALLLALVATGVVAVLSLFRPRLGPEHLVAGFSAAFGVYSLAFLTPFSDIYLQFALAPWLLVVFTRGVTDPRPWRWAAAFALLVALPGNVDVPGLVLASVPLLPLAVYLVLVERRVRLGHLFGWVARAGALTALVSAAVLAKLYLASGIFGQRLNDTEAVDVSFRASSWTESWRGLGNWLSYFRDGAQLLKPQGGVYFSSALVVLCTLVPAMVALAYVWLSRWRPRLLFALMALTSLVLLVGAYPLANPSPAGSRLLTALKDVALLGAFRNVYKAGPGLVIGVSILFGCGAAAAVRRLRGRSPGGAVVVAAVVVVVLAVNALPFWTGSVYNPNQRLDGVPAYWSEATAWLDAQPGDERVLVAPMTSRSRYRWGWVGDDILDSMLARPHAVATGVPLSTPQAANLLEQVSMGLSDPAYQPGSLAPVLRRLGVRYVLLRNDLDWQALGRPRPAAFDGLRNDPDLVPAASFGVPGTNTVTPDDGTQAATRERALPPVEVLELRDPGPPDGVRVTDGRPPAVVSGDGAAWPELASLGALDGDRPVVYSGALEPSELQDLLRQGAPLYITDTNRRRLRVLLGYEPDSSATLAEGQNLDRVPQSLFGRPGSQSVAWYPDAETIYESGVPVRSATGSTPWNRPANAFDGNPATEWKVTQSEAQAAGPTLHVDLRPRPDPRGQAVYPPIRSVGIDARGLTELRLRFSNGRVVELGGAGTATPGDQPGTRRFFTNLDPQAVSWVEVSLPPGKAATGSVVDVAFATDRGALDLTEHVQVPDDVERAAVDRSELAVADRRAPTTYAFSRSIGTGPVAEEEAIRRRFRVAADRPFTADGQLGPGTSDATMARLLDRSITASGGRYDRTDASTWAHAAVDGDPASAWLAPPRPDVGEPLTLTLPSAQAVRRIGVMTDAPAGFAQVDSVSVRVGQEVRDSRTSVACPGRDDASCRIFVVDLPDATVTDTVVVQAKPSGATQFLPVRIDEVAVNDQRVQSAPADSRSRCASVGTVGSESGARNDVSVRIDGAVGALPIRVQGCDVLRLAQGWNLFDSSNGTGLDRLSLTTADVSMPGPTGAPSPAFTVDASSPTDVTLRYEADQPTTIVYQQSWAPGWEATVNGRSLGGPSAYDTLAGWQIAETGPIEVQLRYRGARIFDVGLALSAVGVALCAWLLLRRPRPRPARR